MTSVPVDADSMEQQLLQEYDPEAAPQDRQLWFRKAYTHLKEFKDHWWCQHTELTHVMSDILRYHEEPTVKRIWAIMSQQLSHCLACMEAYHTSKKRTREEFLDEATLPLVSSLQLLDAERVLTNLRKGSEITDGSQPLTSEVLHVVFEVLVHDELMTDLEINRQLVMTLHRLFNLYNFTLPTAGGKYPGLYRLVAHPHVPTRALAVRLVQDQGCFTAWQQAAKSCGALMQDWACILQLWIQVGGLATCQTDHLSMEISEAGLPLANWPDENTALECGRARFIQPPEPVWLGLKVLLQLLQGEAMESALLVHYTSLIECVLAAANQPPPAACAAPIHRIFRTILECMVLILRGLGHRLWTKALPDAYDSEHVPCSQGLWGDEQAGRPATTTTDLIDLTLNAMSNTGLEATHKVVLQLQEALLEALADSPSRQEQDICSMLQYIKDQVYVGNSSVKQHTKHGAATVCLSSMRRAIMRCYPTDFAAHIWGTAACAYVSQPSALHEAHGPGDIHVNLVAAHELRRLQQEAAKLLCVVLQVDSSVLGAVLQNARLAIPPSHQDDDTTQQQHSQHELPILPQLDAGEWLARLTTTDPGQHVLLPGAASTTTQHVEVSDDLPFLANSDGCTLPYTLRICRPVWDAADASHAAEQQLNMLQEARCCPSYWVTFGRRPCHHPAVAAGLLAAVAHLAGIPAETGSHSSSYFSRMFSSSQSTPTPIAAAEQPATLLASLRGAGEYALHRAVEKGHLLQDASQYKDTLYKLHGGTSNNAAAAVTVVIDGNDNLVDETRLKNEHAERMASGQMATWTRSAVQSTLRILLGTDTNLSALARKALAAHYKVVGVVSSQGSEVGLDVLFEKAILSDPYFSEDLMTAMEESVKQVDALEPSTAFGSVQLQQLLICLDAFHRFAAKLDITPELQPVAAATQHRFPVLCAACLCVLHKLLVCSQPHKQGLNTATAMKQALANARFVMPQVLSCWFYIGLGAMLDEPPPYFKLPLADPDVVALQPQMKSAAQTTVLSLLLWAQKWLKPTQYPVASSGRHSLLAVSPRDSSETVKELAQQWVVCLKHLKGYSKTNSQMLDVLKSLLQPAFGLPEKEQKDLLQLFPEFVPDDELARSVNPLASLPHTMSTTESEAVATPKQRTKPAQGAVVVDLTLDDDGDAAESGKASELTNPFFGSNFNRPKKQVTGLIGKAPLQPPVESVQSSKQVSQMNAEDLDDLPLKLRWGIQQAPAAATTAAKPAAVSTTETVPDRNHPFQFFGRGANKKTISTAAAELVQRVHGVPATKPSPFFTPGGTSSMVKQSTAAILQPAIPTAPPAPIVQPPVVQQPPVVIPPPAPVEKPLRIVAEDEGLMDAWFEAEEANRLRQRQQLAKRPPGGKLLTAQQRQENRHAQILDIGAKDPVRRTLINKAVPLRPALRMDQVHAELLSWDIQKDVLAVGNNRYYNSAGTKPEKAISFPHGLQQYVDMFKQLLIEEVRASVRSSVEELAAGVEIITPKITIENMARIDTSQMLDCAVDWSSFPSTDRSDAKEERRGTRKAGPWYVTQLWAMLLAVSCRGLRQDDFILLTNQPVKKPSALLGNLPAVRIVGIITDVVMSAGAVNAVKCKVVLPEDNNTTTLAFGTGLLAGPVRVHDKLIRGSVWYLTALHSMTPNLREFQALCSAHLLPEQLRQFLLHPKPPTAPALNTANPVARASPTVSTVTSDEQARAALTASGIPAAMCNVLADMYNASQQAAVAASVDHKCQFTLIQGPPGTGKTSAILAIISALLAGCQKTAGNGVAAAAPANGTVASTILNKPEHQLQQAKQYKQPSAAKRRKDAKGDAVNAAAGPDPSIPEEPDAHEGPIKLNVEPPVRILVCAQSNAAIDELVTRLGRDGVFGKDGNRRPAGMVRLGRFEATHSDAREHFVDVLVEKLSGSYSGTRKAREHQDALSQRIDTLNRALEDTQKQLQEAEARLRSKRQRSRTESGKSEDGMEVDDEDVMEDGELGMDASSPAGVAEDNQLQDEIKKLSSQVHNLRVEKQIAERQARGGFKEVEKAKRELRQAVVRAAEITVCTLSVAGGELAPGAWVAGPVAGNSLNTGPPRFDALVVDEAAQALEPATLIPFALLKPEAKVVLVGDPRQLPPTVLSQAPEAACLSQSMFERLQRAGVPVHMLALQYRMHPAISRFPSKYFYSDQLADGIGASQRAAAHHKIKGLGPLVMWDLIDGQEVRKEKGSSLTNRAEARFAAALYRALLREYPEFAGTIAVLTPYKAQLLELRYAFRDYLPRDLNSSRPEPGRKHPLNQQVSERASQMELSAALREGVTQHSVDFSTVDGFQGREADVVIFSCVRAGGARNAVQPSASAIQGSSSKDANNQNNRTPNGLGFLNDVRRMNVALTRARYALWVVGHALTLRNSSPWAALLDHAASQDVLLTAEGNSYERHLNCILGSPSGRVQNNQYQRTNVREHSTPDRYTGDRIDGKAVERAATRSSQPIETADQPTVDQHRGTAPGVNQTNAGRKNSGEIPRGLQLGFRKRNHEPNEDAVVQPAAKRPARVEEEQVAQGKQQQVEAQPRNAVVQKASRPPSRNTSSNNVGTNKDSGMDNAQQTSGRSAPGTGRVAGRQEGQQGSGVESKALDKYKCAAQSGRHQVMELNRSGSGRTAPQENQRIPKSDDGRDRDKKRDVEAASRDAITGKERRIDTGADRRSTGEPDRRGSDKDKVRDKDRSTSAVDRTRGDSAKDGNGNRQSTKHDTQIKDSNRAATQGGTSLPTRPPNLPSGAAQVGSQPPRGAALDRQLPKGFISNPPKRANVDSSSVGRRANTEQQSLSESQKRLLEHLKANKR